MDDDPPHFAVKPIKKTASALARLPSAHIALTWTLADLALDRDSAGESDTSAGRMERTELLDHRERDEQDGDK